MIDPSEYDFVDFGSGFGGCIDFAKKKLLGTNGLGFEKNKNRCLNLRKKGYHCLNEDITKLELSEKSVKFVTISHVLEHLNDYEEMEKVIRLAVSAARNFVFIEGPSFEFDEYLEGLGLKFLWRDGHGHRIKPRIPDILTVAKSCGVAGHSVLVEKPHIVNSMSKNIHSLESPPDAYAYDPKRHPPKKLTSFDRPIFGSFIIFLWINNVLDKKFYLSCRIKFRESHESYCNNNL